MPWEETRGTSRVVVDGARRVAHADDAKARSDEASRLPGRAGPKRALVLAGAGLLVVVGAITAVAMLGGDADPPAAAQGRRRRAVAVGLGRAGGADARPGTAAVAARRVSGGSTRSGAR